MLIFWFHIKMPYMHELEFFSSLIQTLRARCHRKDITLPFFPELFLFAC